MRPVRTALAVGGLTSVMLVGLVGTASSAVALDLKKASGWAMPTLMVTKASCLRYYRADSAKCRRLPPIPHVRQACWAAAAAKLGSCIARSSG